MSDDEKQEQKQRPNAGYKLSNENVKGDEIIYHYSRERRLEKARQSVRDLCNTPLQRPRFNLLKPLVRTKPLAVMFFSIIIICVFIVALSLLGITGGTNYTLDGNHISVQAIRFEGAIIMAIDKSTKKKAPAYTGAVEIAVQPVLKDGEAGAEARSEVPEDIFFHKIFFTFEPQEYYRFSVPFDTDELAVVLRNERKTLRLTVKAE
jgi:hypothetical protein